ncbi:hypothetical protein ppKF707_5070 [Metapseudomonas furukawaii]|uniref:Uncharacterized protein n=1 Tax=Metapseudomonas furukawaii TaxID=1149133 RepID=A0AAD1C3A6_METFU|nr:hypothetical protein ppKF707_5070 [Pseudomonas furukawaii]BAU76699.1 hypothetical protein KF707C_50110 [Pseudomonas furukawaii]
MLFQAHGAALLAGLARIGGRARTKTSPGWQAGFRQAVSGAGHGK